MSKRLDIIRKVRELLGENGERHTTGTLARSKSGEGATYRYGRTPLEEIGGFCLLGACAYAVLSMDESIQDPVISDGYYNLLIETPEAQAVLWDIVMCEPDNVNRHVALNKPPRKDTLFDAVVVFNDNARTTWEEINQVLECAEKRAREETPVNLIPVPAEPVE